MSDSKTHIHFAHANSFPAGSYTKFFHHLSPNIQVHALERFAHDDKFPIENNWINQVAELLHFVERKRLEPCVAVGHSFGAVISFIAACQRPDLFKGLVMFDPPLITGVYRHLFKIAKKTWLIEHITPASKTEKRTVMWEENADLYRYFSSRALFKDMDPDCIKDYIQAVTHNEKGQIKLNFDIKAEADIFRTIPDDLHRYDIPERMPAYLITGKNTHVCTPLLRRPFLKKNNLIKHVELPYGGHLFPLEQPIKVARKLSEIINSVDFLSEKGA